MTEKEKLEEIEKLILKFNKIVAKETGNLLLDSIPNSAVQSLFNKILTIISK